MAIVSWPQIMWRHFTLCIEGTYLVMPRLAHSRKTQRYSQGAARGDVASRRRYYGDLFHY